MSNQSVKELTNARDKIAQGWTQGTEINENDLGQVKYCIVGAIRYAILEGTSIRSTDYRRVSYRLETDCTWVRRALDELYPDGWGTEVIGWNDTEKRTQEQVVEAFDRAIKIAERDGSITEGWL